MKKTFLLSLIMAVTMPASAQKDSFQEFAFRLFDKVEAKSETPNCVMSPYSAQMALTLLANGLTEEAAAELKTMMGVEEYSMQQLNEYSRNSINGNLPTEADLEYCEIMEVDESCAPSAEIANAVFLNNSLTPNTDFTNICATYYDGTVENLDFGSPYASEYIDNWASENTHGTIPHLGLDLSRATMLVLANALYFHGSWSEPFYKNDTPQAFHNADGNISYVPTMYQSFVYYKGAFMKEQNVMAVKLPYGYAGNYNMTIFKPIDREEIVLDYSLWKDVQDNMQPYNVTMSMPLFTVDTSYMMDDILKSLGTTKLFSEDCITKVADQNLGVSGAKQISHISVDENGTTASAVTVLISNSSIPNPHEELDFIIDGPFYFTIEHQGEILFIGHISDLSSENVDAINNIETKFADDACYNLQGQRVVESQRGIVVKNGRKYINR